MPSAMPDEVEDEIVDLIGCDRSDILRASGASEGRVAAATEQMARINDAWDTIRKARGM